MLIPWFCVLASALMKGSHPPEHENDWYPGGFNASHNWTSYASTFDESWQGKVILFAQSFCVSLFCIMTE